MGQKVASLEIGLEMTTSGAAANVQAFAGAVDRATQAAVKDLNRIEAATKGMADTSAAVSNVVKFADAVSQSSTAAQREFNRIERAGESMGSTLERQLSVFGKSASEIRQMKTEAAALAAEQAGMTELATRLRTLETELYAVELATARRAQAEADAAAEDKAAAAAAAELARQEEQRAAAVERLRATIDPAGVAQQRFNADMATANELLAAGAISVDEYAAAEMKATTALAATTQALEKQAVASRAASMAPNTGLQNQIEALAGSGFGKAEGSAEASARAMAQLLAVEDQLDARTRALVSAIDPVAGAQQRANAMIAEARVLYDAGKISAEQLAAAEELAANAGRTLGGVHQGASVQSMMLQSAMFRTTESIASGMPVWRIAIQQGTEVVAALGMGGAGMGGALKGVAEFMSGPWGLAIMAGTAVLAVLVPKLIEGGSAADQMKKHQEELADIIDHTTGRIKEQNAALILNAAALTQKDAKEAQSAADKARDALLQNAAPKFVQTSSLGTGSVEIRQDPRTVAALSAFKANGSTDQLAKSLNAISAASPGLKTVNNDIIAQAAAWELANRRVQQYQAQARLLTGQGKPGDQKIAAGNFGADKPDLSLADAEAKLAAATTAREKAEAQAQVTQIKGHKAVEEGTMSLADYQAAMTKADAAVNAASQHVDKHAQTLARSAEAQTVQIANLYATADAYKASDAAALVAEATTKAQSEAIKQQANQQAAIDRQVQVAIAQRVVDGEKSAAQMRNQSAVQQAVNDNVEAGLIPLGKASEAMRDQQELLPLLAAAQAARDRGLVDGAKKADQAIADLRAAQAQANDEAERAQEIQARTANDNQIEQLELEGRLIGENDAVRSRALVTLQAWQYAQTQTTDIDKQLAYVATMQKIADLTNANRAAQDAYNISLNHQAELWGIISQNVQTAAQDMGSAFGKAGQSIGTMASALVDFNAQQIRNATEEKARLKALDDDASKLDEKSADYAEQQSKIEKAKAQVSQEYAAKSAIAQVKSMGDVLDAAKGFFGEHSKGYKVMETTEKAFRAVELALSLKSIAQDVVETGAKLASSAARGIAYAVEAVAKAIASMPFPLNLVAGAATAAALASIGLAIAGSFGGGGKSGVEPANEGTGTVFGDSSAKSDSIQRAIESLKDVDTINLQYSSQMAASLKSIEANIGGLTNILIRTGNIDASAGVQTGFKSSIPDAAISAYTAAVGFALAGPIGAAIGAVVQKIPIVGDIVGGIASVVQSLFGTKTKVVGSGIYGGSQSLGGIVDGGFDASYYSDIQKKKKFFGLTTSTKYSTQYSNASSEIEQQFTQILKGFYDAVAATAGPLGLATDDVTKRLDSFVVNIGKIDLQGLTGQQIQDKLEAVFGGAADDIAHAAIPGLEKFQQVGEGYFETVVRVATTVETVTDTLEKLGQSTKSLGIDASMSIAGMFDSIDDYTQASNTYFEDYYTQAEQAAAKTAQMGKVFDSLGIKMPDTLASFRALVEAQDLTTTSGQQTYAELLKLAPAFADLQSSMNGAASAADILRERQDLQKQLLEAEGDTVALRQLELQGLDASNRALQQEIYDLQDKQKVQQEAAGIQQQIWQLEGDTASIRAAELAALDPANRALQERVYALQDAAAAEQKAAQVAQERAGLMQQLYQLTGNTAALRALQLQQLDPSNQALQQKIWDLTDAQAAAQAAQQLADAWKDIGNSIEDEVKRIRGLTDTPQQGYASLLAQFNAATAAANAGDQDAAKSLPELSKELLDAAGNVATSRQELDRIQAETAAALQAVYDKIAAAAAASDAATSNASGGSASNAPDASDWWQAFADSQAGTSKGGANDDVVAAVKGLRQDVASLTSDMRTGHANIAGPVKRTKDILENVTRESGGDQVAITAPDPIRTKAA